ncbi:MAG: response regulator [Acidobacteriota bacterium]
MHTVLVVDDDRVILSTLTRYLSSFAEEFRILSAEHGEQALRILEGQSVDLLLTDLYMPVMDGFELLAHMLRRFTEVPVIVMSGYEVPEIGNNVGLKGALHYLEKPFDIKSLADTVRQILARTSKGHLTGISLLGFLQLLNFEKKSCLLTVRAGERTGRIDVAEGELFNADQGRLQGESAVFEILSWDDCEIDVSVPRSVERLIHRPLHGVILEAAQDQDESRASAGRRESGHATVPVTFGENGLGELTLQLPRVLERSSLAPSGVIGVAVMDVQQGEMYGYRCFQYWPDFSERAVAAVPFLRRRLELDDGQQVREVLITLEALVELWQLIGDDRRLVFYTLLKRQHGELAPVRSELSRLGRQVRTAVEAATRTA